MQREIGSDFWLNPHEKYVENKEIKLAKYGINGEDYVLLSTGRSAEKMVLETIEKRNPNIEKIALIPPYTCETVIQPFVTLGYKIHTYRIDDYLNATPEMLKEDIHNSKAQVVLFHRYFGFDTFEKCAFVIKEAREKGIIFIEDRTQNLYSKQLDLEVDYTIGSFRKWAGLTDGGFAVCKEGLFSKKTDIYDTKLEQSKLRASYLKYSYMEQFEGYKQKFLEEYKKAEDILCSEISYYSMSPMAQKIQVSLDLKSLKQRRQENYKKVFEELDSCKEIVSITPQISDNDVPLYYVILVKDRIKLQEKLRKYDIYAPIVWPMSDLGIDICDTAKNIHENVLCLPIDQRYGIDDMERMIECVKKEI